jgi:hypothetical protein
MGVPDPTDYLLEKKLGLLLTDIVILNIIVELSALSQFHDDEDIISGV